MGLQSRKLMSKIVSNRRNKIRLRIRGKVFGTPARPRLSVFRSNKQIFVQIIDDESGETLASANTLKVAKAPKKDQAYDLGLSLAKIALSKSINQVVFDRGGYLYHGRVESLARGLREGGLNF